MVTTTTTTTNGKIIIKEAQTVIQYAENYVVLHRQTTNVCRVLNVFYLNFLQRFLHLVHNASFTAYELNRNRDSNGTVHTGRATFARCERCFRRNFERYDPEHRAVFPAYIVTPVATLRRPTRYRPGRARRYAPRPADGSSTRGGSTSVRGRVRSPHMTALFRCSYSSP